MYQAMPVKVIDLTPYLRQQRKSRHQELAYTLLALWTQYLSLGALLFYGLLRMLLTPQVPLGTYSGPLALLWPVSYILLLSSYVADRLLWRDWFSEDS